MPAPTASHTRHAHRSPMTYRQIIEEIKSLRDSRLTGDEADEHLTRAARQVRLAARAGQDDDPPDDDGDTRRRRRRRRDDPPPPDDDRDRVDVLAKPIPQAGPIEAIITPDGVRTPDGPTIPLDGRHPLKAAVHELYRPGAHDPETPLVVSVQPGAYGAEGPLMLGGGWGGINGVSTVVHPHGDAPLCLHLVGEPDRDGNRPTMVGLRIHDGIQPVGCLRVRNVDIIGDGSRAVLTSICSSHFSTGPVSLQDVDLYPEPGGTGWGGRGAKFGWQWSSALAEFLVENMQLPGWEPEEHYGYPYPNRGRTQLRKINDSGGNRTWCQFRAPASKLEPMAPLLVEDVMVPNLGQSFTTWNGGSALTFWGNGHHLEVARNVKITDSKYGALAVTGDGEFNLDWLVDGKWHGKHTIIEDCEFDNRTDDPGEFDGERSAASFVGRKVVEFRGRNRFEGDVLLGSKWAHQAVPGVHDVGEFRFAEGAEIEIAGKLQRYFPQTGQVVTLAEAPAGGVLTLDDVREHFAAAGIGTAA